MGACVYTIRRGVNKYMHKTEIDARLGEIGWRREKKCAMALYMALQARTQTTENCGGKGEDGIGMRRAFECVKQPIVILIVINIRYSHLQES
jgi:hypothetical protein